MNESDSQIEALQRQIFVLLLVLLVVSATLAAYLYYQQHIFRKDAAALQQQATPLIAAFNAERAGAETFINQIRVFGGTHPDFTQQVLSKYGIPPVTPTNAAKPAAAPVKK